MTIMACHVTIMTRHVTMMASHVRGVVFHTSSIVAAPEATQGRSSAEITAGEAACSAATTPASARPCSGGGSTCIMGVDLSYAAGVALQLEKGAY